jgi:hypothetical protein
MIMVEWSKELGQPSVQLRMLCAGQHDVTVHLHTFLHKHAQTQAQERERERKKLTECVNGHIFEFEFSN